MLEISHSRQHYDLSRRRPSTSTVKLKTKGVAEAASAARLWFIRGKDML
jgi:hypothetical protein